jgi:outer membrane protein assembly factor BamB
MQRARASSRRFFSSVATAIALCVARDLVAQAASSAAAATPSSWLQFRAGTDNAGYVPGTLSVEWKYRAASAVRGHAVADGIILLGTESADASLLKRGPDQHGSLIALDVRTGVELWKRDVPSWIHGDPAIYRGRAYVTFGQHPLDAMGGVIAVDLKDGRQRWAFDVDGGVMPAPALDTTTSTLLVAGGDGVLHLLDIETGAEKKAVGLRAVVAMSSPRLDDRGHAYFGAQDRLISYATRDHKFDWVFKVTDLVELATPVAALSDSIVFISGTESRMNWWSAFRALPFARFVEVARDGYKVSGNHLASYNYWYAQQWLLAVDRYTGQLRWKQPLGVGGIVLRNNSGTPVVAGDRVLISSPVSNIIAAFDVMSGKPLWRRTVDARHVGPLTIVGDDIVFGDQGGRVNILAAKDGAMIGRCVAGGPSSPAQPIVVGKTIFVMPRDGWIYATPYEALRRRATAMSKKPCFTDSQPSPPAQPM